MHAIKSAGITSPSHAVKRTPQFSFKTLSCRTQTVQKSRQDMLSKHRYRHAGQRLQSSMLFYASGAKPAKVCISKRRVNIRQSGT
jgi:hypothetical protein